ncbi:D-alanyl-D-alanine carboxypeptidase/D-alanyl-D-alanine-endopeptidase [Deinococcus navajonensis]|uniref:D-alanyl-D-alanine carboxypeptidase/D-alanyl-D-alanine-endopeptidase n=1 Tax=Deinococcus navajonensis TaxID=309884 RepID=A0ABV8XQZ6_9DEIO
MRSALLLTLFASLGATLVPSEAAAPLGVQPGLTATDGPPDLQLQAAPSLNTGVRRALSALPGDVRVGVLVCDAQSGQVLETLRPDDGFVPASTMKLVTAAAVLAERGGAQAAWTTELTVPAAQLGRADVTALTLRGSGDPTLAVAGGPYSLQALARQAYAHGVRVVGQVRLADQALDPQSWKALPLGVPMTALRLSEWHHRPPATAQEAHARLGAALNAQLRAAGIEVRSAEVGRAAPQRPYTPPVKRDDRGRPLPPEPVPLRFRPEQGVASVRSASPARVLAETLRPSDNLRAEELLATLAARPAGSGTLSGALARERSLLRRLGADLSGVVLADGSGLSRDNRLSPRVLAQLLRAMYVLPWPAQSPARPQDALPANLYRTRGNAFIEALPQAGTGEEVPEHDGRGGTLARRLLGTRLDVRAKTGTLPGVSALAGYVTAHSGRPLVFVLMMNGPETAPLLTLREVQDQMVQAIAEAH